MTIQRLRLLTSVVAVAAASAFVAWSTGAAAQAQSQPTGIHEVMTSSALPEFMIEMSAAGPKGVQGSTVNPESEGAYSVSGSPVFVISDQTTPVLVQPGHPISSGKRYLETCVTYLATGGYNGSGIGSGCQTVKKGQIVPIGIIPDWPTKGLQLYTWTHLPPDTSYVTYSYQGKDRAWVRSTKGAAALLVPRPAAFDGNWGVWNKAPFPVLKAFSASGRLIAAQAAPRIGGDRVPTIH